MWYWQSTSSHCWLFTPLKEEKMLVLFGPTYICEQTFSVMKFNKSKYRSSLTDDHLSAVLHIATSYIQPDFDTLVKAQQRLDFSH